MSITKKWNIIFIKAEDSKFNTESKKFQELFIKADFAIDENKALKLIYANNYDIIIHDISVDFINRSTFVEQIKQMKPRAASFAFVAPDDESKMGNLIELGIHAFVLNPEDLEPALEAIAEMDLVVT